MKKVYGLIFLMLLVITPIFETDSVSGASAPRLTEVRGVAITSDGNDFEWENIAANQLKANIPLEGETLYLKVPMGNLPENNIQITGVDHLLGTYIKANPIIFDRVEAN